MQLPEGPGRALCVLLSPRRWYLQAEAHFSATIEHDTKEDLHHLHRARLCPQKVQSTREDTLQSLRLDPTDSEVRPCCFSLLPCSGTRQLLACCLSCSACAWCLCGLGQAWCLCSASGPAAGTKKHELGVRGPAGVQVQAKQQWLQPGCYSSSVVEPSGRALSSCSFLFSCFFELNARQEPSCSWLR